MIVPIRSLFALILLGVDYQVSAFSHPCQVSTRLSPGLAAASSSSSSADDNAIDSTLASVYSSPSSDSDMMEPPTVYQYFHMQQIPTATSSSHVASSASRLDRVVECAEHGECNVEEMLSMMDELERLNEECTSETSSSRDCQLDAVAARNVLKVALASKIMVEEAMHGSHYFDLVEDPMASWRNMDQDISNPSQVQDTPLPTSALPHNINLDRIVQCAEDGECPVGEMTDMIDELERLNQECEGTISRECSLDAVAARNILKVALASQAAMARQAMMTEQQSRKGT